MLGISIPEYMDKRRTTQRPLQGFQGSDPGRAWGLGYTSWWASSICFQIQQAGVTSLCSKCPKYWHLHVICLNLCSPKSVKRNQASYLSLFSRMKWLATWQWLLRQPQCSPNVKYLSLIICTEEQTRPSKHKQKLSPTVLYPNDSHWRDIVLFQALTVEI